jgi:hypothetical protein
LPLFFDVPPAPLGIFLWQTQLFLKISKIFPKRRFRYDTGCHTVIEAHVNNDRIPIKTVGLAVRELQKKSERPHSREHPL